MLIYLQIIIKISNFCSYGCHYFIVISQSAVVDIGYFTTVSDQ